MENSNGLLNLDDLPSMGKQATLPPRTPVRSISPADSEYSIGSAIESQGLLKLAEEPRQHQRASSDSPLFIEPPAWLDELLNEPDSPPEIKTHRRSASDSAAYLNKALMPSVEDRNLNNYSLGPSWGFQRLNPYNDLWKWNCFGKQQGRTWNNVKRGGIGLQKSASSDNVHKLGNPQSRTAGKQVWEGKEGSSASRNDSKRVKQQNAQRARLRRLQYISELEMHVQMLQVEGSEVSSAIHFFDQQATVLNMENRALKQRLDALAQLQKLKEMEQDMLKKELGRLRLLYQKQQQQPQQQSQSQSLFSYNSPNDGRDLESKFRTLAI